LFFLSTLHQTHTPGQAKSLAKPPIVVARTVVTLEKPPVLKRVMRAKARAEKALGEAAIIALGGRPEAPLQIVLTDDLK
jgi:hypothetical protein